MHPCPLAKPGIAKSKGVLQGGGSPGLHKRSAESWGNPARRRSFTLARREGRRPLAELGFSSCERERQRRSRPRARGARAPRHPRAPAARECALIRKRKVYLRKSVNQERRGIHAKGLVRLEFCDMQSAVFSVARWCCRTPVSGSPTQIKPHP